MIPKDLLEILVCPETKQAVREADAAFLAEVNAAITAGKIKNRAGQGLVEPLSGALIRDDGKYAYPVRDGIPIMLVEESFEAKTA